MKTKQAQATAAAISIIPLPVSIERGQGDVSIQAFQNLVLSPDNAETHFVAAELKSLLDPVISLAITKEADESSRNIVLQIDPGLDLKDGGYRLAISESRILMEAASGAGLFYALQSFRQLLPPQLEAGKAVKEIRLPLVEIEDYPRFGHRGMHLDVSRHFFPVEFIKIYIDMIALHKMNVFHWHLTDDNGWRIEIDRYPELTAKSAWRVDREHEPWREWSPIEEGEKPTYGGYYTKEDVREVIRYAAERHITIIPEIEMPGHTVEVFAAYPELSCQGDTLDVVPGSYWPNIDIFCAGNDEVFTFLENVLAEVIELFPGEYIHIGGDEADKTHWKTCPKCQQRIKAESLADEHELQSWFIRKIEKFILSKNRKLVGWDEILEGGLAPEATVMSWRGTKGGVESAQQGHDVIMCPTSHCYFDYYQADPETAPEAIGGFTTLKKVYSYNPVPEELNDDEAKYILGAQGNLWTEYVKTPDRAQYRVLPRMTALSEVVWSPQESRDYDDFYHRLTHLQKRFDNLGWTTAPGSFVVTIKAARSGEGFNIELTSEKPGVPIHFTLDDSTINATSPIYNQPITVNKTTKIRAALFMDGNQAGKEIVKTVHFHKALGSSVMYNNPNKKKYSGTGFMNLVDGFTGSTHYNDGFWQGWEEMDLDVVIDLQKIQSVSNISAGFLEVIKSWIFLPTQLEVSFSANGTDFKNGKTIQITDGNLDGEPARKTAELNGLNENCRYVRIQAINRGVCPDWHDGAGGKAWVFADEIIVE